MVDTAPVKSDLSAPATAEHPHRVVIVGGGFGGLYAAQSLGRSPVEVTLIDRRNFHLFQPLLYQVATGGLSPGDIASPLRSVLNRQQNTQVLLGEVRGLDPEAQMLTLRDGDTVPYDSLILATGSAHHYFGNDHWEAIAPSIKTIEDALEVRRRIFLAFEKAELEPDPDVRKSLLTFVIVGAGPTGVEMAGAIADLAFHTLKNDFRSVNTHETRIILVEGMDRVLPPFAPSLSERAAKDLKKLGVEIRINTFVTALEGEQVTFKTGDQIETIQSHNVLWAAGVRASSLGKVLSEKTGAPSDRAGRIMVEPDFSVPNHPNIFVIGDLAHYAHQGDSPLPGVAPVAMQGGQYVARVIRDRLKEKTTPSFSYKDSGSLAIIGRNSAVVDLNWTKLTGYPAWVVWALVHVMFLIEFDNKMIVMTQWMWNFFTRNQGARLITGRDQIKSNQAFMKQ
ncbi:MAG: NAD(P)/FAD-dependent oxidoreductase [Leptolyngbya sp. SIOISBB]|nr:NAD(P)/FAD-dependent oxidoreductase [Leptolyngbya sp. SIOISBB]